MGVPPPRPPHVRHALSGLLKPEEREMIYNGNARKVFKLKV